MDPQQTEQLVSHRGRRLRWLNWKQPTEHMHRRPTVCRQSHGTADQFWLKVYSGGASWRNILIRLAANEAQFKTDQSKPNDMNCQLNWKRTPENRHELQSKDTRTKITSQPHWEEIKVIKQESIDRRRKVERARHIRCRIPFVNRDGSNHPSIHGHPSRILNYHHITCISYLLKILINHSPRTFSTQCKQNNERGRKRLHGYMHTKENRKPLRPMLFLGICLRSDPKWFDGASL